MQLLVFNAGSSSLKFDLLESPASAPVRRLATGGRAFVDAADGSGLAGSFPWTRPASLPPTLRRCCAASRPRDDPFPNAGRQ